MTNIEKIKSVYTLKEIFSFLKTIQIINIIIYNKKLHKDLGVDIEDYIKISQKYRIGERNGKGSECILNTNILIFKGEYLNGKKMGKEKNIIEIVN